MLVLSRRENSSIKIGSDITVTVLSVRRHQVRLGIDAPKEIRVLRDELDESEFDERRPANTDARRRQPGMKILLVIEDNPLHAKLIHKSLSSRLGAMVTVAETAKVALDALAVGSDDDVVRPNLILLDMQLPDSTGLEVLRRIRMEKRLRRTPVVMLTCCHDDSIIDECMESGANAFVVKSARWEDFRAACRALEISGPTIAVMHMDRPNRSPPVPPVPYKKQYRSVNQPLGCRQWHSLCEFLSGKALTDGSVTQRFAEKTRG